MDEKMVEKITEKTTEKIGDKMERIAEMMDGQEMMQDSRQSAAGGRRAGRLGLGRFRIRRLAALALLAGCLCAGCASPYKAERVQLMKTEGQVDVSDRRGKEQEPVPEMKLYSGYQVATKEESFAWLNLDSVKLAKMDVDSQISITKRRNALEVVIDSGNLYFNIKEPLKEDETLDIRTSNMAVGIRGTCGWVEVEDQEHMRVYILEGTVTCRVDAPESKKGKESKESKETTVSGGQMAELTIDPEAEEGQVCQIVTDAFVVEEIAGFVLEELVEDEGLCEKIYEESGMEIYGTGGGSGDDGTGDGTGSTGDGTEDVLGEGGSVESTPLDPEAEAAWQQAYLAVLNEERAKAGAATESWEAARVYQLYDIDKDGIPELFVHFGDSEAAAHADLYTCRGGETVLVEEEMGTGHTSFFTYPGENAVLSEWAHQGYFSYSKVSLVDGELTGEDLADGEFAAYADDSYPDPQKLVPGSLSIPECQLEQDILLYRYREIMGNMERDRSSARSVPKDEALRQRFLDVIWEDGMVYGVSADGYGNTPGYLSFSTYCEPGVISGATRSVLAVRQYAFADVDLDGQEECILRMEETEEDARIMGSSIYVALHLEEDQVYAYSLLYFSGEVLENGVFVSGYEYGGGDGRRMLFDKGAGFFYDVQYDHSTAPVQWVSFAGQGSAGQGLADVAGEALPLIDPMEISGAYIGQGEGAQASVSMYTSWEDSEDGGDRVGNIYLKTGPYAYYGELVWAAADTYKIDSIGRSLEWEGVTYRDVTAADGNLTVEAGREDGTSTLWFYRGDALIDSFTMTEHYVS